MIIHSKTSCFRPFFTSECRACFVYMRDLDGLLQARPVDWSCVSRITYVNVHMYWTSSIRACHARSLQHSPRFSLVAESSKSALKLLPPTQILGGYVIQFSMFVKNYAMKASPFLVLAKSRNKCLRSPIMRLSQRTTIRPRRCRRLWAN